ncbi:MAG: fused MFS/spermidine synthase [Acidobacteria bacterium]|nr:fused MFS/spermidine synthase [Acidobacteriota bacterium]
MRISLDSILILLAFACLGLLAVFSGSPFFDAFGNGRLTYLTVLVLPALIGISMLRKQEQRVAKALKDWWQVVAILLVYESLKHLHANQITEWLGISPKDSLMLSIDEHLFFGKTLALWLQPLSTPWFSQVMWFFYVWVYYLGPVALLGWAYFQMQDDELFLKLRRGLVFCLLGGYLLYLLVPVEGPLFLVGEKFSHPILTQPTLQRLTFSTLRYNWDCFPSLHTGLTWLLTVLAWSRMPKAGRVLCVTGASGVTLATVVLRFHYGVDLLAGLAWAGVVWFVVTKVKGSSRVFTLPLPALPEPMPPKLRISLKWLAVLFILSGATALLVEQAFEKLLTTLVGASTQASAMVLAAYFLGLTLGGWAYGRLVRRSKHPLRVYAFLEGGIAAWSLMLTFGSGAIASLCLPLLSLGADNLWLLQVLRFVVASVWILPPTMMMGATFPAIVDSIDALRIPQPKRAMSRFYALNLLGAFLAATCAPYLLFPKEGLSGTLLVSFALDAAVAFAAFRLDVQLRGKFRTQGGNTAIPASKPPRAPLTRGTITLLILSFVSGIIFFALEVLWTHLLSAVAGNSVYAFSTMLSLVLAGLLIGSALSATLVREGRRIPSWTLALLMVTGSIALLWTFSAWPDTPHLFTVWGVGLSTFGDGELLRWILSSRLVLPPAIVLGMIYPWLFRTENYPKDDRGAFTGWMVGANAIGCVLGALAGAFWLIPALGSEYGLMAMGSALLALAVLIAVLLTQMIWLKRLLSIACGVLLLIWLFQSPWNQLALTSGEQVYNRPNQVYPQTKLVSFREDSAGGITTVVKNPEGVRDQAKPYLTLLTNGKFQGNDAWEIPAQTGFALIPMLHLSRFDSACVVGFGTGRSSAVVAAGGFKSIDIAEISPGIVQAAQASFQSINNQVLSRPEVHLQLEDGRNFLLLHPNKKYDLITMELSSIWFAGTTSLYSREFYQLAKSRLAPNGVFQQWVQIHHLTLSEIGSVLFTLRSVFPQVSLWIAGNQGVLVATDQPQIIRSAALSRMTPSVLGPLTGRPPAEAKTLLDAILKDRVLSPEDVDRNLQSVSATPDLNFLGRPGVLILNTDDNRYLEYATPRYALDPRDLVDGNLQSLHAAGSQAAVPMEPWPAAWAQLFPASATAEKDPPVNRHAP